MKTALAVAAALILGLVATGSGARGAETWEPVGLCGGGAMFSLAISPLDPNLVMMSCDMSGAYISRDGGKTWTMFHHSMLKGCTSCAAVFHPKTPGRIVAPGGWGGGLRASSDAGRTWQPYGKERPWRQRPTVLYIDPDLGDRLFVGTSSGAYATDDDGATWRACEGAAGSALGFAADRASPRDARVYFIGTSAGVFRSDDGGRTFKASSEGLPQERLASFAGGSDGKIVRLYATVPSKVVDGKLEGGVYVSKDAGRSWQRAMNPQLNVETKRASEWAAGEFPQYRFALTTDVAPDRAYVHGSSTSYFPPNHSTVYRTDDAGTTWRPMLFSDPRFKAYNAADDWLTKTLGQRWQDVPLTMTVAPGKSDVVMTSDGMFASRTEDGGRFWRVCHAVPGPGGPGGEPTWINNGLVVTTTWNYYVDPHENNRHYICYTDIGFARSLDGGRSWIWEVKAIPWKNTCYELAFDPDVPGRVWGAFSETHDIPNSNVTEGRHRVIMRGGVAASSDFARTWTKTDLPAAPAVSVILDPASPRDSRTLYASLFEKGVYRSDDGGKTWQRKSEGLGSPENLRCCRLIRHADGTLLGLVTAKRLPGGEYTLSGTGLYRSTDKGEHWTKITDALPLYWPKDFTVHPKKSDTVLLGAGNVRGHEEGALYRTTDGGKAWEKLVRKGPEHFSAFYHPDKDGWIYMTLTEGAPGAGLWLSRDDGKTWDPFDGLPFSNVQRVHLNPADKDHIFVTTFGGSVWKGPIEPGK